jgi:aromatic-L-amino-acid/L-tryptophan decarboxylase
VRDGDRHRDTFSAPAAYLRRETRGLAAGSAWPCDLGPDLSRSFRALKTWFTLKTYGTEKLGAIITRTCALAGYLEARVLAEPRLELFGAGPAQHRLLPLRPADANKVNGDIVIDIQESGIAAPSTTRPACDPCRHRQSPHRYLRHRRADCCGTGFRGAASVVF